uniref:Uncharacterized protein n=1 Tax=Toxoplasma gondii COUG TaxID=1074873 RepID=A0A2G8Y4V6_TOXGO|nr:hypothetical protein TGCOUG_206710 [Toxoplasma gondii COUG]
MSGKQPSQRAGDVDFPFCVTPAFGSPACSPPSSPRKAASPSTSNSFPTPPPPRPLSSPRFPFECAYPSTDAFNAFFSQKRDKRWDPSDSEKVWPFAYDPFASDEDTGRPSEETRFVYGPYLYPRTARTVVPVNPVDGDRDLDGSPRSGTLGDRRRERRLSCGGHRKETREHKSSRKTRSGASSPPRGSAPASSLPATPREPKKTAKARSEMDSSLRPQSHREVPGKDNRAAGSSRVRGKESWAWSQPVLSSAVPQDELPTFGMRKIDRRKAILGLVRPVPIREPPLHDDSLSLPATWKQSTFVAPPTEDEVRSLKRFPEEIARRTAEDGAVFRHRRHPFVLQYAEEKVRRLLRRIREDLRKLDIEERGKGAARDEEYSTLGAKFEKELLKMVLKDIQQNQPALACLEDEYKLVKGDNWTWTMLDRDRWTRSGLLRRLMKEGKVLFQSDLEERQYAQDYERFLVKPFRPPRLDWGGEAYYASIKLDKEDYTACINELLDQEDKERTAKLRKRDEERRRADAELERQKKLLVNHDRVIKYLEVADGRLPRLFEGVARSRRKKHPKNCTVSSGRLRLYAEHVDSITLCPFLIVDMDRALCQGWRQWGGRGAQIKHMDPPRGIPPDKYPVTKESMQAAMQKLKLPGQADEAFDLMAAKQKKRERQAEPEKVLGGGRYAV